jgi:hypothetical protein
MNMEQIVKSELAGETEVFVYIITTIAYSKYTFFVGIS